MTVRALSSTSITAPVGDTWLIVVAVLDADGELYDQAPVVTVTLPNNSTATPTVETVTAGVYRVTYTLAVSGRYVARAVSSGYGAEDFAAYVEAVTTTGFLPTATEFHGYTQNGSYTSWSDSDIEAAIQAEASAQRRVCRIGAVYPPDLRMALLRRAQVHLDRRSLPKLVTVDGDGNTSFVPMHDPEVRRLERPYRKLVQP